MTLDIFKNKLIEKAKMEEFEIEDITLLDFIEICNELEYPVFEIKRYINPFSEPHTTKETKIYDNMTDYRKTMPEWSARAYDYENDRMTYYLNYPDIINGNFNIMADNKNSSYEWNFKIVDDCIVVHSIYNILD